MIDPRKCADCNKIDKLTLHHDPPKSKIKKGVVVLLTGEIVKVNNRLVCKECHQKADAKLGVGWGVGKKQEQPKKQRSYKNKRRKRSRYARTGRLSTKPSHSK